MTTKEDDPLVFFRERLRAKQGLKGLLDSRTGRISDRSKWTVYIIDHTSEQTRNQIKNLFVKF